MTDTFIDYEIGEEIIYCDKIIYRPKWYNPENPATGLYDPINPRRGIVLKTVTTQKPDDEIEVAVISPKRAKETTPTERVARRNIHTRTHRRFELIDDQWEQTEGDEIVEICTSRGWLSY